jgi:hypothetical protein
MEVVMDIQFQPLALNKPAYVAAAATTRRKPMFQQKKQEETDID